MTTIRIRVGPLAFTARWEDGAAPKTCAAFRRLLPYRERIIQARWSGEAGWIPLGDLDLGVGAEHTTAEPAPGALLSIRAGSARPRSSSPTGSPASRA